MDARKEADEPRERTVLIKQAADLLGVSRRTVYYRIGDGQLRTIRTRCGSQRVLLSSIEALIKQERSARQAIPSQAEPLTFQVEAFSRDA